MFFREVVELLRSVAGCANKLSFFGEFHGLGHLFVRIVDFKVRNDSQVMVAIPVLVEALQGRH